MRLVSNAPQTLCESSDRQQAVELLKRRGELQNFEVQMRKRDAVLGLYSRPNAADGYMEGVIGY